MFWIWGLSFVVGLVFYILGTMFAFSGPDWVAGILLFLAWACAVVFICVTLAGIWIAFAPVEVTWK